MRYGTDIGRAVNVALELIRGHPKVLETPSPAVITTEPADPSVNLQLRAWVNTSDFWPVKNDLTTGIHNTFNREGISIHSRRWMCISRNMRSDNGVNSTSAAAGPAVAARSRAFTCMHFYFYTIAYI
ncbi:mechanosensitive ion channel family protein [Methanolobus chelungpuianus]|uniref:mechanosensitive ion channel family protein n=1 Tax=Methanolobus chelungpuianus TaxID=502115 RepID=UPI002114A452